MAKIDLSQVALRLANRAAKDPAFAVREAVRLQSIVRRLAKRQAAVQSVLGRRPNLILSLGGVAPVGAGTTSPGYRLEIPRDGRIIEMRGSVASGLLTDMALTGIRVSINGVEELITDGRAGAFARFTDLFSDQAPRFPIDRPVHVTDVWYVYFQVDPAAPGPIVPSISFFERESKPRQ